jgi:hypothetical protein
MSYLQTKRCFYQHVVIINFVFYIGCMWRTIEEEEIKFSLCRILMSLSTVWHLCNIVRMQLDPLVSLHIEMVAKGKYIEPWQIYGCGLVTTSLMPWQIVSDIDTESADDMDETDIGFKHLVFFTKQN